MLLESGGLEMVALIAAMLFLQMYLTMDVCCCLLASLRAPGWRPRFPNPKVERHPSVARYGEIWGDMGRCHSSVARGS